MVQQNQKYQITEDMVGILLSLIWAFPSLFESR